MPQRLSTVLKVKAEDLDSKGVFNSFVDIDSKLYVDPALLKNCNIPEFANSYNLYRERFENIIVLLKNSSGETDRFWREARKLLTFKEFPYVALGYSSGGRKGNAIGTITAKHLVETSYQIIKAGITDPVIFELIGLFEKGVGPDRISDMTIRIIRNDIIKYTQRVSSELNIPQKEFGKSKTQLPYNPKTNEPIAFVPKILLRDLPLANSWEEIEMVCAANNELRNKVNKQIGDTWKAATSRKIDKKELMKTLVKNPKVFEDLISQYKRKHRTPYNFEIDPAGEVVFASIAEQAVNDFPLNFASHNIKRVTENNIFDVVILICEQYKKLIEVNGLEEVLYNEAGKLRNERFAQKLFFAIADTYCEANNLNLSREPNAGSGALDFKVSKGYKDVVSVEIKYSTNTNLTKGFTHQLPKYNLAEGANKSVYVIIKTAKSDRSIQKVKNASAEAIGNNKKVPEIFTVDGTQKKSASKLR